MKFKTGVPCAVRNGGFHWEELVINVELSFTDVMRLQGALLMHISLTSACSTQSFHAIKLAVWLLTV